MCRIENTPSPTPAELQAWVSDLHFAFAPAEVEARERFNKLAHDTHRFMISAGLRDLSGPFSPWPESADNFLTRSTSHVVLTSFPPNLLERWRDWNREYYLMRDRNPALELRDLMQGLSERSSGSSWPLGLEARIQDWVDAGDPSIPPPGDEGGPVDPKLFQRLQELRRACGGWVFWDDRVARVIFVPEEEWRKVLAAREATAAEQAERARVVKEAAATKAARITEVLAHIRGDAATWEMLKGRESEENLRVLGPLPTLPSKPVVDALLEELIFRELKADDGLDPAEVVMIIRNALRGELGLRPLIWRAMETRYTLPKAADDDG